VQVPALELVQTAQFSSLHEAQRLSLPRTYLELQVRQTAELEHVAHPSGQSEQVPSVALKNPSLHAEQVKVVPDKEQVLQSAFPTLAVEHSTQAPLLTKYPSPEQAEHVAVEPV
jgi:hypothetical protein